MAAWNDDVASRKALFDYGTGLPAINSNGLRQMAYLPPVVTSNNSARAERHLGRVHDPYGSTITL